MTFHLLHHRPLTTSLTLGLGITSLYFSQKTLLNTSSSSRSKSLLYCDNGPAILGSPSNNDWSYTKNAKVPVVRNGRLNSRAVGQVSGGSVLGLLGGLAVSTFSKPLAVLVGLLVFGVQFAASRGFNVIPYTRMQKYAQGIDLRSAVEDNVAFKLSFGAVFALAAFAEF